MNEPITTDLEKKKNLILNELMNVAIAINKQRFTREEFIKNSSFPISVKDIENCFGSFTSAMLLAGLRPQKHNLVTDEDLFKAYGEAYDRLGHYPLGHPGEDELGKITRISGGTFRKRFGGLKNFLFEFKNWQLENKTITKQKTISGRARIVSPEVVTQIVEKVHIETFENRQRYVGRATENLVVAELLFRGFNAQLLHVDEGIDVVALNVKLNEIYLIQVKHTYYDKINTSGLISITISSFERNKKNNVYYLFVLEREENKRDFLILPFSRIDELMKIGIIVRNPDAKQSSFRIVHKSDDDAYINAILDAANVSRYLNAWDVLL